jgi:hypothetical protein
MAEASFNVPFLPQTQITEQILSAMHQANEENAQQQAAAARQKSLQIAQTEANTASQRLAVETPLIQANVTRAQLDARQQALTLAQNQNAADYINGPAESSEPHPAVATALGNQIHPDVALVPPQNTVSNPAPSTPVAQAPIADASQVEGAPISSPPNSGPAPVATPALSGLDRDTQEAIRLAGGATPSELAQLAFYKQQVKLNPTHDGVINYLNSVHSLFQKRNDPTVAAAISFQRAGLSETAANAAALRNTNIASQLDKNDADTSAFSGEKSPAAISQLKGIIAGNTPTSPLTADVLDHAKRQLVVAQNAQSNEISFAANKKKAEDDIANGDPKQLAELLNNGDAAWSQLVSTRKPEFLTKVIAAWKAINPNASVAKNQADYQQATNPQVRSTLDLITTMTDRSGSIAIAEKAAQKLPQFNSQVANAVFNATTTSFGSSSVTDFHTAMLGLADEYSKVMGGGVSSDTGRAQALNILHDAYSNNQITGAIATMKADIQARKSELIRGNRVLEQTYGAGGSKTEPVASTPPASSAPPSGATHTGVSSVDGKTYYLDANNQKLGLAQ